MHDRPFMSGIRNVSVIAKPVTDKLVEAVFSVTWEREHTSLTTQIYCSCDSDECRNISVLGTHFLLIFYCYKSSIYRILIKRHHRHHHHRHSPIKACHHLLKVQQHCYSVIKYCIRFVHIKNVSQSTYSGLSTGKNSAHITKATLLCITFVQKQSSNITKILSTTYI